MQTELRIGSGEKETLDRGESKKFAPSAATSQSDADGAQDSAASNKSIVDGSVFDDRSRHDDQVSEAAEPVKTAALPPVGSGNPKQREMVDRLLTESPELVHSPKQVAQLLSIKEGSAKRLLKDHRDQRSPSLRSLLGPVLVQNVRIVGRTAPGEGVESSELSRLGPWSRQDDGKFVASASFPQDGNAKIFFSVGGTLEFCLGAPRGLTPSEVLLALALVRLPVDPESEATLSYEVLRDGSALHFEGIECRTFGSVEGWLLKLYNHHDSRGTLGRVEVRAPAVKVAWREIEAFLCGREPLGRDTRIEELTAMVRDNSVGMVDVKKALRRLEKRVEVQTGRQASKANRSRKSWGES